MSALRDSEMHLRGLLAPDHLRAAQEANTETAPTPRYHIGTPVRVREHGQHWGKVGIVDACHPCPPGVYWVGLCPEIDLFRPHQCRAESHKWFMGADLEVVQPPNELVWEPGYGPAAVQADAPIRINFREFL